MVQIVFLFLVLAAASIEAKPYENYVVNGTDATVGEFPYVVSMRVNKYHSCGGSILDDLHVLTAAHCVYQKNVDTLTIQYGSIYLDKESPSAIQVESYDIHPDYKQGGAPAYPNDVAVITLVTPMVLSEVAQPTVMPKQDTPTPTDFPPAVLVGWGYNSTYGVLMTTLQKVTLMLYSDEKCKEVHTYNVDSAYHVCGGVPQGGMGQCSGDSGGPLTVNGVQRGTVSWSIKPCTVAPYPGVYANIASYTDWICSIAKCTIATN